MCQGNGIQREATKGTPMKLGTHVKIIEPSIHAGQTGVVTADYEQYILVTPDDQSYAKAYKDSTKELKVFQVDARRVKEIK